VISVFYFIIKGSASAVLLFWFVFLGFLPASVNLYSITSKGMIKMSFIVEKFTGESPNISN